MRTVISVIAAGLLVAGCQRQPADTAASPAPAQGQSAPAPPLPNDRTAEPVTSGPTVSSPAAAAQSAAAQATARDQVSVHEAPPPPRYREVTVPSGTVLHVRLETPLASDTSRLEERVTGTLERAVVIDDLTALAAGTPLHGAVTSVERSNKVKGRARLAFRFTSLTLDDERIDMRTATVAREARATKAKDAKKIGIPAAGGAIIGAIIGGGKGSAIGTAVGGGAGTAAVLTTRGEEVRLPEGTAISVRLSEPLTVRVQLR